MIWTMKDISYYTKFKQKTYCPSSLFFSTQLGYEITFSLHQFMHTKSIPT